MAEVGILNLPVAVSLDGSEQVPLVQGTGDNAVTRRAAASLFDFSGGSGGSVQAANAVLAGPTSGDDAAPSFRALVAADVPAALTPTSVSATAALTARNATATPAAASAVAALLFGTAGLGLYWGTGSPDSALTAAKGSLYLRTDGSSSSTRIYVNSDGASAWTNVTTAA